MWVLEILLTSSCGRLLRMALHISTMVPVVGSTALTGSLNVSFTRGSGARHCWSHQKYCGQEQCSMLYADSAKTCRLQNQILTPAVWRRERKVLWLAAAGSPDNSTPQTSALLTCRLCKKQFSPAENAPNACRYHTAHYGGEYR